MDTQRLTNRVLQRTMRGLLYAGVSASFILGTGIAQAADSCPVYGLQDNDLNNSQLFEIVIDPGTLETTSTLIGPEYIGYDIEALAIHPVTGQLFAASGDDTEAGLPIGTLYTFDNGDLQLVASAANVESYACDGEVSAMDFTSDGETLWAWVDGKGLYTFDQVTGQCSLFWAWTPTEDDIASGEEGAIEDIAVGTNANGDDILFGVSQERLYAYNLTQGGAALEYCDSLPSQAEAIEILPDGTLMYALHAGNDTRLYQFNMEADSCQVMNTAAITGGYYDMEGLAVAPTCKLCPPGAWQYGLDSLDDGVERISAGKVSVGGNSFEIHGIAMKQQGDIITVAISGNLPHNGGYFGGNHIGWGDLIFDFSGSKAAGRVGTPSGGVYGVHFASHNDSGVSQKGVYEVTGLKNVTLPNAGFKSLYAFQQTVLKKGNTPSLGSLPASPYYPDPNSEEGEYMWDGSHYFSASGNKEYQVPTSIGAGNLVAELTSPPEYVLHDLEFDLSEQVIEPESKHNLSKTGDTTTMVFSFKRQPGMTGDFVAYLFTECLNDGVLITGTLDDCPDDGDAEEVDASEIQQTRAPL